MSTILAKHIKRIHQQTFHKDSIEHNDIHTYSKQRICWNCQKLQRICTGQEITNKKIFNDKPIMYALLKLRSNLGSSFFGIASWIVIGTHGRNTQAFASQDCWVSIKLHRCTCAEYDVLDALPLPSEQLIRSSKCTIGVHLGYCQVFAISLQINARYMGNHFLRQDAYRCQVDLSL